MQIWKDIPLVSLGSTERSNLICSKAVRFSCPKPPLAVVVACVVVVVVVIVVVVVVIVVVVVGKGEVVEEGVEVIGVVFCKIPV